MNVTVTRVSIPRWSSIGYGWGHSEEYSEVVFVGDHRPMRALGEAIGSGLGIGVEIEDRQVLSATKREVSTWTSSSST